MAFNDTYRESIQSKHIANVGFTSTAKGVTNEGNALKNPHQVLASQIPAIDVVNTHGPLVADGISAGLVEQHTIKLTADPTVNDNKAWFATEDQCTEAGHAARGVIRVDQWMRYAETQYKLRLFEDDGGGAIDMAAEILPSEGAFNWEYDASAGLIYFDADPSVAGKTTPLWGLIYTYVGDNVQDGLGATSSGVSDLVDLFDDTNEPTGFVDRTSSDITFDDGTNTLTVSGVSFGYYIQGEKYTKEGAQSIAVGTTEGMHYVFFRDGVLSTSNTWSYDYIYTDAYVAELYWDATNSTAIHVGDERHGITMDGATHLYLHTAFGTQRASGLGLTDISSNQNGSANAHATVGTVAGIIRDEDITIDIPGTAGPAQLPVFYKTGANGYWRVIAADNYPIINNHSGATLPKWNQWTGSAWELTELVDGNLVLAHIFATNDIDNPYIAVAGQAVYNSVASAREGANEELNDLVLAGMPFAEFSPVASIIYMAHGDYDNTPNARIITDADGNDYVDWTLSGLTPNPASITSHANLTGRDLTSQHPAASIYTDTSNFDGALTVADQTVQAALDTLDDAVYTNASGIADLDAKIDTTSGTLQNDILWEVVDTPSEQIRPKVVHQGKAIYTAGNLTIGGDLTVSGTTSTIHSQELTVADKLITVNAGEAGAGITGDQYAGIEVDRGSETDYMFVFDEVQDNFRVGISGSLQAVATREDAPVDTRVPFWNDSAVRFDTSGTDYITIASGIDMYASSANVLSLDELSQTLGDTDSSYIYINQDGSSFNVSEDSVEVFTLEETSQTLGVSGTTTLTVDQDANAITFAADGSTVTTMDTDGLSLSSGASVNEILDSNDGIDASSTDDQLATAKAIYDNLGSTALSGTPTYMYYVGDDGNITETSVLTYDASSEYLYFNSPNDGYVGLKSAYGTDYNTQAYVYSNDAGLYSTTASGYYNSISSYISGVESLGNEIRSLRGAFTPQYLSTRLGTTVDGDETYGWFRSSNDTEHTRFYITPTYVQFWSGTGDFPGPGHVSPLKITESGISLEIGTNVNEIVTFMDVSSTDDQLPTAKAVYDAIEAKPNDFLGLTDTISSYTANNMLYTTASGVEDTANVTYVDGSGLDVAEHMAIGNSAEIDQYGSPTSLGISDTVSGAGAFGISLSLDNVASGPGNATYGIYGDISAEAAEHNQIVGAYITANSNYDNTIITEIIGLQGDGTYTGNGGAVTDIVGGKFTAAPVNGYGTATTFTNITALEAQLNRWDSNAGANLSVTNAYGLNIKTPGTFNAGTATNLYGLYIADHSASDFTNEYNIYSAGTGSLNYFEGKVQVGSLEFPAKSSAVVDEILNVADGDDLTSLSTDAQLASAKLIYNTISGVESTLDEAIIWEVVDTPTEQIRPRVEHQGKAIYSAGNLTIGGDLTVSGTTTTVHSEELTVADKVITVNAGEAGAGITGSQYAGIEVDRGTETDYMFVFDEVQDNFRVGISGSLQAVATREDNPTDMRVPWWNDTDNRFDTSSTTHMTVNSGTGEFIMTSNGYQNFYSVEGATFIGDVETFTNTVVAIDSGDAPNIVDVMIGLVSYAQVTETNQRFGKTGETNVHVNQTSDYIELDIADGTVEVRVDANGMSLKDGASVNEILDSSDTLVGSTDDQLATAALVYNEILTLSGTVENLDHNTGLDNIQGGNGSDEYYHLSLTDYNSTSNWDTAYSHSQSDHSQAHSDLTAWNGDAEGYHISQNEYNAFSSDGSTWTFSQAMALATGGSVNEIVSTVTSGTTQSQLPTAKAVWDLTEAAAAAVHTHYDVDAVYVSDTSWTYGTGFSANPDDLQIYVNGVKQRFGASYDCTVAVPGGVLTITFNYNVYSTDWVNINYTA